jgi:membrane protein implicated in regulation of membrane protease activity
MESIVQFFAQEPGWIWLAIGATLFTLDVLAPGFFLLWFALAAGLVGVLLFAVPMDVTWQVLAFCVASVVSLLAARRLWGAGSGNDVSDKPLLNQRAQQFVGRSFRLATPIEGGQGRITAGDGLWPVRGPDLPEGAMVRVVGAEGTVLIVEAA